MIDENITKDRIKKSLKDPHGEDKQLSTSFYKASELELEKTRENNNHQRKMLGKVGGIFGHEKVAPVNIAAIFAFLSLIISIACLIGGYYLEAIPDPNDQIHSENLFRFAERFLGASLAALSYIFGKGGK